MRSVLLSIHPKWCELIASGKKTIEIRKTRPKLEPPFKCYIYCTNKKPYLVWGDVFRGNWETEFTHLSGYNRNDAERIWDVFNGKVIGEFVCDEIIIDKCGENSDIFAQKGCLIFDELKTYSPKGILYGWHISDLIIYGKPRELREFYRICPEWDKEEFTKKCHSCEHFYSCDYDGKLCDSLSENRRRKKAVEQGIRAQCLLCRKALGKEESGRRHVAQACRL